MRTDLIFLEPQPPEAALAVHRHAELADVGEELHDPGDGDSDVTDVNVL